MGKFPPDWFDLGNYEPTRKFKPNEWRDVFESRRGLYKDYLSYTEAARENGLNLQEWHSSEVVRLREELSYHSRHVRCNISDINDVWAGCGAVSDGLRALIDLDNIFLRRLVKRDELRNIIDDYPIETSNICNQTAYIDFSRTDTAIIADFKKWLVMKREKLGYQPSGKPLSVSAIANFYPNCVLPYLDLRLNEIFHGRINRVYTWNKYADILFPIGALPAGSNGVDKVRLTTHKMAIRILESDINLIDPC